jgi:hypothetical protein
MYTRYIPSVKVGRSSDFLHGCFVSCLVDSSKNAAMGHWGAGLSASHLGGLKEVVNQNLTHIVAAEILFLREEDKGELVCSYRDYLNWLDRFSKSVREEFNCIVKTTPYNIGAVINLDLERNLLVN